MQSFKRGNILFLQALFIMFAAVSCVKEKAGDGVIPGDERTEPRTCSIYFNIQTGYDSDTRASGDFTEKEETLGGEYAISSKEKANFAIVFREGLYDGVYPLTLTTDALDGHVHEKDAIYKATYNLEREQEDIPSIECLIVLNAPWFYEELEKEAEAGQSKSAIMDLVWRDLNDPRNIGFSEAEGNTYFSMSSSVYSDRNGNMQDTVVIGPEFIITGEDTEEDILDKIIYVHVERLVAKFTFKIKQHDSEDQTVYEDEDASPLYVFNGFEEKNGDIALTTKAVSWRIKLTGWGMNALETENTVFKRLSGSGNSAYPAAWNDAAHYRSYWSIDPHYSVDDVKDAKTGLPNYPWQYRDIRDKTNRNDGNTDTDYRNFHYYGDETRKNVLRNYSYDDLFSVTGGDDFNRVLYTPENTYDYLSDEEGFSKALDGREHLLAGTHLIVGAELQTSLGGAWNSNDLYRDRYGIYYEEEKDCLLALSHAFNRTLTSQMIMKYKYYNWSDPTDALNGTIYVARPKAGSYNLYYIIGGIPNKMTFESDYSAYTMALATVKDGDGKRLLWPGNRNDIELAILTDEGEPLTIYEYKPIDPSKNEAQVEYGAELRIANQDDIKSLLYEWVGAIDHFSNGKMYYAAPVTNLRSDNDETPFYGVVRNSWYNFVLNDVKSIGTPVDDAAQPIVPLIVKTNDQLNISINILGWHRLEREVPIIPKN